MVDLKKCQFDCSSCGNLSNQYEEIELVVLKDLVNDLGPLFDADIILPEYELIRMRSTTRANLNGFICAKHRYTLGEGYRASWKCNYLHHPTDSRAPGRNVKWILYKYVKSLHPQFVLGSLICSYCKNKLAQMMAEEPEESIDKTVDSDYVPSKPLVDEIEKEYLRKNLDRLTDFFEVERILYQISGDIKAMSPISLNYLQRMYRELQNKLKKQVLQLCCTKTRTRHDEYFGKQRK